MIVCVCVGGCRVCVREAVQEFGWGRGRLCVSVKEGRKNRIVNCEGERRTEKGRRNGKRGRREQIKIESKRKREQAMVLSTCIAWDGLMSLDVNLSNATT